MRKSILDKGSDLAKKPGNWFIYLKYSFIGALIAVITILLRNVLGRALPADSPTYYAASIIIAYAIGILLSYVGHRFFSFSHVEEHHLTKSHSFGVFVTIALLGMLSTTILSLGIRYLLPVDAVMGRYGASFAFAAATLITSIGTFILNSIYTFRAAATSG